MKIGAVTTTNSKGQIVIPKNMRDILAITPDIALNIILTGHGIYICPIEQVLTRIDSESSYIKLLEKTKGTWSKEDPETDKGKKRTLELQASKSRKKAW